MFRIALLLGFSCLLFSCQSADERRQALLDAAEQGQTLGAEDLLKSGVAVDVRDDCRFTPLMQASLNGHIDVVDRLLLFGADVEAADKAGYTPLLLAATNGHDNIAEALLRHGANPNHVEHSNGWTALIIAARAGNLVMVEQLLNAGALPEKADGEGLTAMHWAARMDQETVAQRLVDETKR